MNNNRGRPKGTKNTPKRTLDLRDFIPTPEPKFKITTSQRKLLKTYNPEGLPDLRTKEFKNLSYEEKEDYILSQLAIANENKKEKNKKIDKKIDIIGDVKYNLIKYNNEDIYDTIEERLKLRYPTLSKQQIEQLARNEYADEVKKIIKFERARGNILFGDIKSNFYDYIIKITKGKDIDKYLEQQLEFIIKATELNITSFKNGYNNNYYFYINYLINYKINVFKNDIDDYIKAFILLYTPFGDYDNDLVFLEIKYKNNYNIIDKKINELQQIKMRDAAAYNLEGHDNQEWDTKKGRCVFDYIINRYGNIKGLKLICNDKELINIFGDDEALINGVDTYQINKFCKYLNIPLYAYDENNNLFHYYYPEKKRKDYPSLMFKIINNHFYPIPEKKRKALINKKVGLDIYSNLYNDNIKTDAKQPNYQLINLVDKSPIIILSEMMKKNQKIPLINMFNNKISSIKLNDIKYLFTEDSEQIKEIINKMNLDYKGQSIIEITNLIIKDKIKTSSPNIYVYNQLLEAKKNRSFNGLLCDYDINDVAEGERKRNIIAYDINKCYSSIMYEPLEDWVLLDLNNNWEDFKGDIKLGLYFVETDDNLLFKGDNIYSSALIKKAIEEKIKFKIIKVMYANKKQDKNLFVDIIDEILKITDNKPELYKLIINCISGMMGKNKNTYTKANINKSLEHIYITLDNYYKIDSNIKPFITKINETDYYIYGYNKDVKKYDVNIPMYIQILDQSNIKLYDMIKKIDGELIGRKVDCAIIRNPKNKLICGDKWGDYRLSLIPKLKNREINNNISYLPEIKYKNNYNIIDSDKYEKILNIALNGGCLITGSAGTGKSYVIHKITEKLGKEKVAKITPTNKSALNIKGHTIHKFLKLNSEGKIPRERIETIKKMNLDLIIIDEISMINKRLWQLLFLLKEESKFNFLLLGDEKQLPPIEDDADDADVDYFNSPVVKYLSDYKKINLEVIKRYDSKLCEVLEDVENIKDDKLFNRGIETRINICYFNNTRKRINKFWNRKEKTENSILIKADEDDEQTQNIYLYQNLPLIARKNLNGGDFTINNEKFIVEGFDDEFIFLSSDRPDENGEIHKHKIDIKIEDLQKNFLLNYCSTTHKAQGETITENFTIYDFNFMSKKCKYTALSRARNINQINIIN